MNGKKGFTLVELLAVIAILAILVIIALPNVLKMFNNAKQSAFETEVKEIAQTAQKQWLRDSITSSGPRVYTSCSEGTCTNPLDMNTKEGLEYYVRMDSSGRITRLYVKDDSFQYGHNGEFDINNVTGIEDIAKVSDDNKVDINNSKVMIGGQVSVVSDDGTPVTGLSAQANLGDYVRMQPTLESFVADSRYILGDRTIYLTNSNLWRIININDNGTLELILDKPAVGHNFSGDQAYYAYVGYLNEMASKFENSNYTIGSRCPGYDGQTEYIDPADLNIPSKFFVSSAPAWETTIDNSKESIGWGDVMYQHDLDLIKNVYGAYSAGGDYYLASRYSAIGRSGSLQRWVWGGRYISYYGELTGSPLISRCSNSCATASSVSAGFRPIIVMKANIPVTGGNGNNNSPYTLQ